MPTNSAFDVEARPSDSPLVESVWRSTSGSDPGSFTSVAFSNWELVVTSHRGRTWVAIRGPETVPTLAPVPEDAEFLGITFKHGAFMPDLPARTLVDAPIDLPDTSGPTFRLMGGARHLPTFDNADTFVASLVRERILVADPVVQDALRGKPQPLSPRSLQRRFLRATGLTQATLLQIDRARDAVDLLEQGTPILDAANQTGYADQSHLTRALRRFWGYTPAQVLRGETR
jgi:hypothetical protein